MKVDIGIEKVSVELIDHPGAFLRDIGISQLFADNRAVFGFHQPVIIGVSWTGFGKANDELVQQLSDYFVDEFRSIIGMEAMEDKGELLEHELQDGGKVIFGYLFHRGHYLPLSYLIYCIDMVHSFLPIVVSLMNGVDPDITRLPPGVGFGPLSNSDYRRLCFSVMPVYAPVGITLSHIVQMGH